MKLIADPQYKAATLLMAVPTVYARLLDTAPSQPEELLTLALSTARKMRLHACGSAGPPTFSVLQFIFMFLGSVQLTINFSWFLLVHSAARSSATEVAATHWPPSAGALWHD